MFVMLYKMQRCYINVVIFAIKIKCDEFAIKMKCHKFATKIKCLRDFINAQLQCCINVTTFGMLYKMPQCSEYLTKCGNVFGALYKTLWLSMIKIKYCDVCGCYINLCTFAMVCKILECPRCCIKCLMLYKMYKSLKCLYKCHDVCDVL